MKRFLLYLLALSPLFGYAQIQSGYYRIQNDYTQRYMSIVDTRASISASASAAGNVDADLEAIYMLKDFEKNVAYNPATICYVKPMGGTQCNLLCQGLDIAAQTDNYLSYKQRPNGAYWLYGAYKGASRYLGDESYEDWGEEYTVYSPCISNTGSNRDWWVLPVDQSDTQYFGIKPDITATSDNSYWSTMYAGFPFKVSDSSKTKVYRVSKVDVNWGCAVITEVTGDVSAATPVLFCCTSESPSSNKLTLLDPSQNAYLGSNYLVGNYYCNDIEDDNIGLNHRNVKEYNSSTMRMLGVTSDGKPAFVKSNIKYLPANKCYLSVSSNAPDILTIVTEEEYATGIKKVTTDSNDSNKVIYDLQGRQVVQPSKGLYIVNGKKVVIK